MPRISGPLTRCSNTSCLAMKRTIRLRGRNAKPASAKSRYPMWLIATTPPPWGGTFSEPVMSNFSPSPAKTVRANPMTDR